MFGFEQIDPQTPSRDADGDIVADRFEFRYLAEGLFDPVLDIAHAAAAVYAQPLAGVRPASAQLASITARVEEISAYGLLYFLAGVHHPGHNERRHQAMTKSA